eukprot:c7217_g1_i1.p1 GENE.c7217_g1_i1~~c7217_g1_i1.p1  ORF type:complete len:604 (-),score=139.66 c7217_g1_i1:30-1811(-)
MSLQELCHGLVVPEDGNVNWEVVDKIFSKACKLATTADGAVARAGFVPVTVKLLQHGIPDPVLEADATFMLWTCMANPGDVDLKDQTRTACFEAGGIEILCRLLTTSESEEVDRCMGRTAKFCSACALWNISRTESLRAALRASGLVHSAGEVVLDVTQDMNLRFFCALILCNLVGEEDAESSALVRFDAMNLVTEALKKAKRGGTQVYGALWHVNKKQSALDGLVMAFRCLCSGDENKARAQGLGAIELMIELMDPRQFDERTQANASEALQHLSFNADVAKYLRSSSQSVDTLKKLAKPDSDLCDRAKDHLRGIFFRFEETSGVNPTPRKKPTQPEKKPRKEAEAEAVDTKSNEKQEEEGWVMLSYNWVHQKTMIAVADTLRAAGFRVWMDISQEEGMNMTGSTIEAMAAAVEGAKLVVVAMSSSYQMSANCRLEAEFALTLRKPIVPLMMETSWKPTGWLGLLLGAKLYIDLSQPSALTAGGKAQELLKEVSRHLNKPVVAVGANGGASQKVVQGARTMTVDQVGQWLQEKGFAQYGETFKQLEVDGEVLFSLNKLGHNWQTFAQLRTDFGVTQPAHALKLMVMIGDLFP